MRSTVVGLVLASLPLAAAPVTPASAQQAGGVGVRMHFSLPGLFSFGGEVDVGVGSHLSVVGSLQKWVAHRDCVVPAVMPSQPQGLSTACDFDGLSLGAGVRLRVLGTAASTPFFQLEAGRHRFDGGSHASPFVSFRGGYTWFVGPRGVLDIGIKRQWTREPVLGEGWGATTALQLSAGALLS